MEKTKNLIIRIFLVLIVLHGTVLLSYAQHVYRPSADGVIKVEGTSSLHDWTSESSTLSGNAKIQISEGQIKHLENVKLVVPVNSIKSGKSMMDKNTYTALKDKKFPEITFSVRSFENGKPGELKVKGDLSIAGVTRNIEMPVKYEIISEKKVNFSGNTKIKMTDFNIDPPTAMMGTVKTGDEITITFNTPFIL
jgi:hypothetical protein